MKRLGIFGNKNKMQSLPSDSPSSDSLDNSTPRQHSAPPLQPYSQQPQPLMGPPGMYQQQIYGNGTVPAGYAVAMVPQIVPIRVSGPPRVQDVANAIGKRPLSPGHFLALTL